MDAGGRVTPGAVTERVGVRVGVRRPDEAQRNPGWFDKTRIAFHFMRATSGHPGYVREQERAIPSRGK